MASVLTWLKNLTLLFRMRRLLDSGRGNTVFEHLWRGEHDLARRMLEAADHPTNAFQLACLELELGRFDVAERWALRLPASDPLRAVVLELIGRRSTVPGAFRGTTASWLSALEAHNRMSDSLHCAARGSGRVRPQPRACFIVTLALPSPGPCCDYGLTPTAANSGALV